MTTINLLLNAFLFAAITVTLPIEKSRHCEAFRVEVATAISLVIPKCHPERSRRADMESILKDCFALFEMTNELKKDELPFQ